MKHVLLVDDDESILKSLRRLLTLTPVAAGGVAYPLKVSTSSDPQAALARAETDRFDLVISDYRMPGMDGVAFLKAFRARQPEAVRMILSGYADLNGLVGAINEAQIARFVAKPWNDYELITAIGQALALHDATVQSRQLADEARLRRGTLSAEDFERQRLERLEPGITRVRWGADGSVLLDETGED
jgi:DNA-binding NtrC family response regulator